MRHQPKIGIPIPIPNSGGVQFFIINIPEIIKASNEAGLPVDVYEHKTVAAKG